MSEQQSGPGEYNKTREGIQLAHLAATQAQIAEQNEYNERLRRHVNAEAVGLNPGTTGGDVGTQLAIDSPTTVNHYHQQAAGSPIAPPPEKKRGGKLLPLAAGVALLATGAALPAGIALLSDSLSGLKRETVIRHEPAAESRPIVIPVPVRKQKKPEVERVRYSLDLD